MDKIDFAKNILNIRMFQRYNKIKKLNKPFNIRGWLHQDIYMVLYPEVTNRLVANAIEIFSGVLQGVYFGAQRPLFLNIATLADSVGGLFRHAVDLVGSQFDKNGNVAVLWSEKTKKQYETKFQAVVDEFSNYIVKQVNAPLNGSLVAEEIIAERVGIKTGYLALEQSLVSSPGDNTLTGFEDYPARKLFWLVNAVGSCVKYRDEYLKNIVLKSFVPPAEVLVNEVYRNNPSFSKDWGCPTGSYMNPNVRDEVW